MKNLVITFTVILFAACNASKYSNGKDGDTIKPGASPTYQILKQEEYGGKETAGNIVIKTQGELSNLYTELGLGPAPKIDFSEKTVIALFMGQKNSGGYSIGIESISSDKDDVIVSIKRKSPEGMATMALSQPYCIASIATTKAINFK